MPIPCSHKHCVYRYGYVAANTGLRSEQDLAARQLSYKGGTQSCRSGSQGSHSLVIFPRREFLFFARDASCAGCGKYADLREGAGSGRREAQSAICQSWRVLGDGKQRGRQRYEEKTGVRTRDVMLRDAAAVGVTEARGRGGGRCLVAAARGRRAAARTGEMRRSRKRRR